MSSGGARTAYFAGRLFREPRPSVVRRNRRLEMVVRLSAVPVRIHGELAAVQISKVSAKFRVWRWPGVFAACSAMCGAVRGGSVYPRHGGEALRSRSRPRASAMASDTDRLLPSPPVAAGLPDRRCDIPGLVVLPGPWGACRPVRDRASLIRAFGLLVRSNRMPPVAPADDWWAVARCRPNSPRCSRPSKPNSTSGWPASNPASPLMNSGMRRLRAGATAGRRHLNTCLGDGLPACRWSPPGGGNA